MRFITLLFALLLAYAAGFAQALTKADYLADLQYLKDTLPKRHINLFAKITKQAFDQKIDELSANLQQPDPESFTTSLYALMVAIGDEHTHIEPVFTKVLPLKFNTFTEGIFVTATDQANSSILLYQLKGINGHPTDDIIKRCRAIVQNSNPSLFEVGLMSCLNNPAILKGLGIINTIQEAKFELAAPNGKVSEHLITSADAKSTAELVLNGPDNGMLSLKKNGNYWYAYDAAKHTLYVNYNRCAEQEGKPFEAFNKELFEVITKKKPARVVLDLRYNSGGNSAILQPFIDSVSASYLNRKDKFFVLIGKQTFSSALMNAVKLKRTTQATLIGQPTSGSVNHYGELRGFRLPHTKMIIGYSTRYWETWPGYDGPLKPDVNVTYSISNFRKGIDEALLKANGA